MPSLPMTFADAAKMVIPFGKYCDQALDQVGSSDEGLRYLDWLRGQREESLDKNVFDQALDAYLDDPTIRKELERL